MSAKPGCRVYFVQHAGGLMSGSLIDHGGGPFDAPPPGAIGRSATLPPTWATKATRSGRSPCGAPSGRAGPEPAAGPAWSGRPALSTSPEMLIDRLSPVIAGLAGSA